MKIQNIGDKLLVICHPVHLFHPVCLLGLENFPLCMIIPSCTYIRYLRVDKGLPIYLYRKGLEESLMRFNACVQLNKFCKC